MKSSDCIGIIHGITTFLDSIIGCKKREFKFFMWVIFQVKSLELCFIKFLVDLSYDFLNKRVKYAIEFATTRYPIMLIKLAMIEAMKG